MTTPKHRYQEDLKREDFVADSAQAQAVELLNDLQQRLISAHQSPSQGLARGLLARFINSPPEPEQGLYLWGGVGRGKTYLMDCFFESLPFERKMRVHFHRFMRRVHADLTTYRGHSNPLEKVAADIANEAIVICFDEFYVSDITDAMLLGTLFKALFGRGVCLVATSNIMPDQLYSNGLQRQRFLPAIALLNKHCMVINVDGGVDHRLRKLEKTELYHSPLNDASDNAINLIFDSLKTTEASVSEHIDLQVAGRSIPVQKLTADVVWFDFASLCDGPRSQNDYIDIALEFHAVVISGVPALGMANDDVARRFINLVDEFYDRNVKLVISAAQPLESLYGEGNLSFEFERTKSRLLEMQSYQYLARPHQPT